MRAPLARLAFRMARAAALAAVLIPSYLISSSPAQAQDWGGLASISTTMGVNDGRICTGEGTRGDIGCSTTAPYISSLGYIGIGTTSPSNHLDIYGGVSATTGTFWRSSSNINHNVIHVLSNAGSIFTVRANGYTGIGLISSTLPPSTTLHVSGSIRLAADGAATCDTNRTGAVKYQSGDFSFCRNGSSWETLASIAGGGTPDRIISGTTQAIAYNNTSLSLVTAGTERMVIGTTGNVGIGQQPLSGLALSTSGTSYFNGFVGIGTISPSAPLHVKTPAQTFFVGEGPSSTYVRFKLYNDTGVDITPSGGSDTATYGVRLFRDVSTTGPVIFNVLRGDGSSVPGAAISGNNNPSYLARYSQLGVGGITTPLATLHVAGSLRLAAETSTTLQTCDANRTGAIKFESNEFSFCRNGSSWETLASIAGGGGSTPDRITSGTTQAIAYNNTSLSLVTAGTERMVIGTAGKVGIGQQPNTSFTLAISGSAGIAGGYLDINNGTGNVAVGNNAILGSVGGAGDWHRTALGASAGANMTGRGATAFGYQAGKDATGSYSLYAGYLAGGSNTGSNVVHLGNAAGRYNTGANTVLIGFNAGISNTFNNIVLLGNNVVADKDNQVVLGNPSTTEVSTTGTIKAAAFVGDGSLLTNLPGGAGTFASLTDVVYSAANRNIFGPGSLTGAAGGATDATALGHNALAGASNSGAQNVAIGTNALYSNTVGYNNVAVGYGTLSSGTTARQNVAIGWQAMASATTARLNVAVGLSALTNTLTGSNNTAVGVSALGQNTTGGGNTAVGHSAISTNQAGTYNTAMGNGSLALVNGSYNTAVGFSAGYGFATPTFTGNALFGASTGYGLSTGNSNTLIGTNAGYAVSSGSSNTLVGFNAGAGITTGSNNLVLGTQTTPYSNTGDNQLNIANAIWGNTGSGMSNANLIGINVTSPTASLQVSGTVSATRFIGDGSLLTNIGVGAASFASLTDVSVTAGSFNVFGPGSKTGANAGVQYSTAYGINSLAHATNTASFNTAMGSNVLPYNSSGDGNSGVGFNAINANTSGAYNTAMGVSAMQRNTTGAYNTAVGTNAGQGANGAAYSYNSLFGTDSGANLTTGSNNTLLGNAAGFGITTGSNNIIIGNITAAFANTGSYQLNIGNAIWGNIGSGNLGNANRIGINISSPTYNLDVSGTLRATQFIGDGSALTNLPASSSDRITSGTTQAIAYTNTSLSLVTAGTERMIIGTNGNVSIGQQPTAGMALSVSGSTYIRSALGINTTTPSTSLQITGTGTAFISLSSTIANLQSELGPNDLNFFRPNNSAYIGNSSVGGSLSLRASNTIVMSLRPSGYIGIGTVNPSTELDVSGSIQYTGTLTDVSDRRAKTNIKPLPFASATQKLSQLAAVQFEMKSAPGVTEYGFIAQDVEKVFPHLVKTLKDPSATKALNYIGLIPVLVQANQDLAKENATLKAQQADILKRLEALEKRAN